MGCAASRLEDEEAVKLCRDRRDFIRQALEHRNRFASSHIAYIESLRRVSKALRRFVAGDDHLELNSDPCMSPFKQHKPDKLGLHHGSYDKRTVHVSKYLMSGPNPSVSVQEAPRPVETIRAESHYPMDNYGGADRFYAENSPPMRPFSCYTPYGRPGYTHPSPQEPSQWDFWNPFSSLENHGSYDNMITDDELARLQQVREEEGIPELEEEDDECEEHEHMCIREDEEEEESDEDKDEDEDEDDEEDDECENSDDQRFMASTEGVGPGNSEANAKKEAKGFESKGVQCGEASENRVDIEIKAHKKEMVRNKVANAEETPGFTVYINRRPVSLAEAMKDIDSQFSGICRDSQEVSRMLEASRAQFSSSNDLSVKMLNPVALLRSASSRSSSSRFLLAPSSTIDDLCDNDTSSCYSEESCSTMSGSHHSTLDRLYTWEKKLYEEVKAGERLRIDYEKRLRHLRSQDVRGEEPSSVDKTRAALRSLHTRMKVSIQTVQSISRRIEALRDEELNPQLMELIQGLSRMWRAMAERHKAQKRTVDDARLLFLHHRTPPPPAAAAAAVGPSEVARPPPAAVALELEVRAWRGALGAWLSTQSAYARALAAWARRCLGGGGGGSGAGAAPPAYLACMEWARAADAASEARVMDGMDFFVAGVGSVCAGAATGMEGLAGRVLCAGMAAVTGSLAEFAAASADSHAAAAAKAAAATGERGKGEEVAATAAAQRRPQR